MLGLFKSSRNASWAWVNPADCRSSLIRKQVPKFSPPNSRYVNYYILIS
nr:MAG TPA: hypothetical protein [Caudoviricetes sp.]